MGRYEIRRELGRGGMGVVYEAFDTKDRALVALKTIGAFSSDGTRPPITSGLLGGDSSSQSPEGAHGELAERLYLLKREFRMVADIQHPNLVRFGELSSHGGQWFFTMELVRGRSFVDYVRDGSLDERRLRAALAQLVSALAAIHDAGLVHRDVKPSNVLVTEEGRVVVLDFGLMTARSARTQQAMEGTPDYMAPEQLEESPVGPAADWYALGATLFVAMTGRPPFVGDFMDRLSAKLTQAAPAPHEIAPEVTPDLDSLCVDLLRTAPEDRPDAAEIRARLGMATVEPWASTADAGLFVGRDRELAELVAAFDDVKSGRAVSVAIEGEPGIGKSSLAHRFLGAAGRGAVVLSGRCYEQESVPFKGIDAIVDSISQYLIGLPDERVASILSGGVRFLATVFPVLNRIPQVAEATSNARTIDNPMALRDQAFGEFERLVSALASSRPVIFFLDDLQWADRGSLELLSRALDQTPPARCLFVATMRTGVELPPGAADLLAKARRVSLAGLSESEARILCAELGGGRSWSGPAERKAVIEEAAGHPLYLAELVRSSRRDRARPDKAASLEDVLAERFLERDPLERRFLEVLAIAGAPIEYGVVARAAGIDAGEAQTRLSALRAAQLVRISRRGEERLALPYHDRVRESILRWRRRETTGEHELSLDHLRLGRALLQATPREDLKTRVFVIVQHANAARHLIDDRSERLELAGLNLLAAQEALLATAYDAARGYADLGLELVGETGWRDAYATACDLLLERMRAEFLAGDAERAARSFDSAKQRIQSPAERTALFVKWIELQTNQGAFRSALASGRERLREIGVPVPARATTLSVLVQYAATRWAQAGRSPDDLRALPESSDPTNASASKLLMAITPAVFWLSSNLLAWISLRLARMSMLRGVTDVSSYGFASYGVMVAGAFRRGAEAAALGKLALALNERFRNEVLAARLHLIQGLYLAPWVQPFREGLKHLEASYAASVKHGETTYEAFAACCMSYLALVHGVDLAGQRKLGEWAREVCARRKDRNTTGSVVGQLRLSGALTGEAPVDFSQGLAVDPVFYASAGEPHETPAAYGAYWHYSAWAAYFFGEISVADSWVREARSFEHVYFGYCAMHDFCFLQCLVAAKLHDDASWARRPFLRWTMARHVRKLRAWAEGCAANFEPAWLIACAELARVRGETRLARDHLDRAVASARAHGNPLREGLAFELAATLAEHGGDAAGAAEARDRAADAYRRCGAAAKAERLAAARSDQPAR
jgi:predicted ATPase